MKILALKGDGIGPEIVDCTIKVLNKISNKFKFNLDIIYSDIGFSALEKNKTTFPNLILKLCEEVDGIILGPVDHNNYPSEKEGGLNPSGLLRTKLNLFSNIRPAKSFKGTKCILDKIDLVIVRENTEGFYADRNMFSGNGEIEIEEGTGISIRKITKQASEKIAKRGFEIAKQMNKNKKINVHAIHKANVLRLTDGIFLKACRKISKHYPEIEYHEMLVDAATAHMVRKPEQFDVLITTNMFGDILSDLASELSGSLGLSGSLNVGDTIPMAQAQHGAAIDIMNKGIANPISLIFSVAMLLKWLGKQKCQMEYIKANELVFKVIENILEENKYLTPDLGGTSSSQTLTDHIIDKIENYE